MVARRRRLECGAGLDCELGLMEYHRASVAIDAGRRAIEAVLPQLKTCLIDAQ